MLIRNVLWEEYELGPTRCRLDISPQKLVKAVENDAKGAAWPLIRSECFSFGGCRAKEVPRISQLVIPKRPSCYEL